jgi:hypothetical protein
VQAWVRAQGEDVNVTDGLRAEFFALMPERAKALMRVVGARILRAGQPADAVARVRALLAADKEMFDEAYDAALPVREEAVRRVGGAADVSDWTSLTTAYARVLDARRARAALAKARAAPAGKSALAGATDSATAIANAARDVTLAETIDRLADATSKEDRLARAKAAFALVRNAPERRAARALDFPLVLAIRPMLWLTLPAPLGEDELRELAGKPSARSIARMPAVR